MEGSGRPSAALTCRGSCTGTERSNDHLSSSSTDAVGVVACFSVRVIVRMRTMLKRPAPECLGWCLPVVVATVDGGLEMP